MMMQFILIISMFTIYGNCIPTSLLSHTKNVGGVNIHHNDHPSSGPPLPSSSTTIATTTPTETVASEFKDKGTSEEISYGGSNINANADEQKYKMTPHKRGVINTQYFNEKDLPKNIGINNLPSGIGEEDGMNSGLSSSSSLSSSSYPDALDVIEDYPKSLPSSALSVYRQQQQQSNDNVDNIYNQYEEPIALPLQYHQQLPIFSNYYTDRRRKRASSNGKHKLSLRLKRESKLSAADLLALLALINSNEGNNIEGFSSARPAIDPPSYNSYIIDDYNTRNNDNQFKGYASSLTSSPSLQQLYKPRQIIDQQQLQYQYPGDDNDKYGNIIDYLQNDNGEWWTTSAMNDQNIGPQYEKRLYDEYPITSNYLLPRLSKRYMVAKRFIGGFDTRYNTPDVYSSINQQLPFNKNYYQ